MQIHTSKKHQETQQKNNWLLAGLFSVLGSLFYLMLTNYSEVMERAADHILSAEIALTIIVTFNIMGFTLVHINTHLSKYAAHIFGYENQLLGNFLLLSFLLLIINYGIILIIKWLSGMEEIFIIHKGGFKLIIGGWTIETLIVGLLLIIHSSRYTLQLYKEKEQLKEMLDKAQYRALQNQLNPHFLFNSLNTLMAEIQYDPTNALHFTQHLSDVYRYVLQQSDRKMVSLREELAFLNSFIFLHRVRLGECLFIEKEIPDDTLDAKIPPLTLQLLAENVVKHNYIDEKNPMTIHLTAIDHGNTLAVSNKLQPKQETLASGKGLKNLSERYWLLCAQQINVKKTDTSFTVLIPLIHE